MLVLTLRKLYRHTFRKGVFRERSLCRNVYIIQICDKNEKVSVGKVRWVSSQPLCQAVLQWAWGDEELWALRVSQQQTVHDILFNMSLRYLADLQRQNGEFYWIFLVSFIMNDENLRKVSFFNSVESSFMWLFLFVWYNLPLNSPDSIVNTTKTFISSHVFCQNQSLSAILKSKSSKDLWLSDNVSHK